MTEHLNDAAAAEGPRPAQTRKSDGQDGPPLLPVPLLINPVAAPRGPNAALKEPAPKPGDGVDPNHPHAARLVVLDADAGVVGTPDGAEMRRKIAICGFATSTRQYILGCCDDPTWEIWGLNQLYRHIPRADRWFDIHYNWDQEVVPGTDHRQWARECGIPFYTIQRQPDVPTSVRYPLDYVLAHFDRTDYFTSTIPYMLSLAVMEIDYAVRPRIAAFLTGLPPGELARTDVVAVTRRFYAEYAIGVFGIDLVVGGEYFHEKPCAEFWIGAAALGRGISMAIPAESALCKQLYRYGTDPEPNQLLRSDDVKRHMAATRADRDEHLKRLWMMEGVLAAEERMLEIMDLRQRGAVVE